MYPFPWPSNFLAFSKFATEKSNWNPFIFPLLLEDCAQGKVTGIGAKDKWMIWFDLKNFETLLQSNFEIFKGLPTRVVPGDCF